MRYIVFISISSLCLWVIFTQGTSSHIGMLCGAAFMIALIAASGISIRSLLDEANKAEASGKSLFSSPKARHYEDY